MEKELFGVTVYDDDSNFLEDMVNFAKGIELLSNYMSAKKAL